MNSEGLVSRDCPASNILDNRFFSQNEALSHFRLKPCEFVRGQ